MVEVALAKAIEAEVQERRAGREARVAVLAGELKARRLAEETAKSKLEFRLLSLGLTPYGIRTIFDHVSTVIGGDFEWDDAKAAANLAKHGVSFEEAATVFADGQAVFVEDPGYPDRFHVIGVSAVGRVLFVVHVERGYRERIISARKAMAAEEAFYIQGSSKP